MGDRNNDEHGYARLTHTGLAIPNHHAVFKRRDSSMEFETVREKPGESAGRRRLHLLWL